MNAPPPSPRYPINAGRVLILAAVVFFILAALVGFAVITSWTIATLLGLLAVGLACYAAASLVP